MAEQVQQTMDMGEAIKSCFSKYFTFRGRASRAEYWWFYLFTTLINGMFGGVGAYLTLNGDESLGMLVSCLPSMALLFPGLSVFVRRLHDIGRSGWNFLWAFLPIIGWIILLVYMLKKSKPMLNEYGPVPCLVTAGAATAEYRQPQPAPAQPRRLDADGDLKDDSAV